MIAFAAALLFLASAGPHASAVRFSGVIDRQAVARFSQALPAGVDTLVIESPGGEEDSALDLADLVRARKLRVRVDTYCLSACALYVLPASPTVEVGEDALVGFHQSAVGIAQLMLRLSPKSSKTAELDAIARRAVGLYLAEKRDPKIMLAAFYAAGVDCMAIERKDGEIVRASTHGTTDVWVPSREMLAGANFPLSGSWPATREDAQRRAAKYLKPQSVVAYGPEPAQPRPTDIKVMEGGCPANGALPK